MAGVVVLDAGVLIALYDSTDHHHPWALELFTHTLGDDLALSSLTMAEVMVHPIRAGMLTQFDAGISGLNLTVHAIDHDHARQISQIRASTTLKMPDAVVLQLALRLGATLATTDQALATQAMGQALSVFEPGLLGNDDEGQKRAKDGQVHSTLNS